MTDPVHPSGDAAVVLFHRAGGPAATRRFGLAAPAAGRLDRALLCATLDRLGALPLAVPVVLLTDSPLAGDDRLRLGPRRVIQLPQRGGDFEERLCTGLRRAARLGFRRLVVVGSDTPDLSRADLMAALSVDGDGAVVGPARDGGVYLLSLACGQLPRLRGLPWCTDQLLTALQARLGVTLLPVRRADVDDAAAVAAQRRRLERLCRRTLGCGLTDATAILPPAPPRLVGRPFGTPVSGRAPPLTRV